MVLKRPLEIFNGFGGDHHHWMFFGGLTIAINGFSMVFGVATIAFNGFLWFWTIYQTMRWFRWIVVVYTAELCSLLECLKRAILQVFSFEYTKQKVRVTFPIFAKRMTQYHNDNQNPRPQNVMIFFGTNLSQVCWLTSPIVPCFIMSTWITHLSYADLDHPDPFTCRLFDLHCIPTWITNTSIAFMWYISMLT